MNLNYDLSFEHPLILDPTSNEFLNPGPKGLTLNTGEKIFLACTGKSNFIKLATKPQELDVECVNGNLFKAKDGSQLITQPFKTFSCNDYPESIARRTGKKCSNKYTETEIGFETSKGFVRIMTTCLDESKKDTLYSVYSVPASIRQQQIKIPRPPGGFQEGEFYPGLYPTPSSLYSKYSQLNAFSKLLKSDKLANEYIKLDDDYFYIARGHLAAKADFLYASQQRATFYYVNVAPQWQVNTR